MSHNDPPVDLILRIQEMNVAGSHHRLMKLLSQLHNLPVHVPDVFHGINIPDLFGSDHKFIIPARLYFQVVIKIDKSCNLHIALTVQQGTVKLPLRLV